MAHKESQTYEVHIQELLFSEHGFVCLHLYADCDPFVHILELVHHLLQVLMPLAGFCLLVCSSLETVPAFERT